MALIRSTLTTLPVFTGNLTLNARLKHRLYSKLGKPLSFKIEDANAEASRGCNASFGHRGWIKVVAKTLKWLVVSMSQWLCSYYVQITARKHCGKHLRKDEALQRMREWFFILSTEPSVWEAWTQRFMWNILRRDVHAHIHQFNGTCKFPH